MHYNYVYIKQNISCSKHYAACSTDCRLRQQIFWDIYSFDVSFEKKTRIDANSCRMINDWFVVLKKKNAI